MIKRFGYVICHCRLVLVAEVPSVSYLRIWGAPQIFLAGCGAIFLLWMPNSCSIAMPELSFFYFWVSFTFDCLLLWSLNMLKDSFRFHLILAYVLALDYADQVILDSLILKLKSQQRLCLASCTLRYHLWCLNSLSLYSNQHLQHSSRIFPSLSCQLKSL